jgi:hypothetical protein
VGYLTSYRGEIAITPPIPYSKAKGSPFFPNDEDPYSPQRDVMFDVDTQVREVDEGTLTIRQIVALIPILEDPYKGRDIIEHVQEAVDAHPEHEFTGRLDCAGDDTLDMWRLEVHERRAVKVKPRIVWPLPDGGEEVVVYP